MRKVLQDDGIALMELLIGLAIVALLSVGVLSLTLTTHSAGERVHGASEAFIELTSVNSVFQQLVASAIPAKTGGRLDFRGDSRSVRFQVRSPFAALPPGLYQAELSIAGEGSDDLSLSLISLSDLDIQEVKWIAGGVRQFRYYGSTVEAAAGWHEIWADPNKGPLQVQLVFEDAILTASPYLLHSNEMGAS